MQYLVNISDNKIKRYAAGNHYRRHFNAYNGLRIFQYSYSFAVIIDTGFVFGANLSLIIAGLSRVHFQFGYLARVAFSDTRKAVFHQIHYFVLLLKNRVYLRLYYGNGNFLFVVVSHSCG